MASVPRERNGMAGGAVNTARQLGTAFGIAVFGSTFSSRIADHLAGQRHGSSLAGDVASGGAPGVLALTPVAIRAPLDAAVHDAVASALGTTYLIAGIAGLIGAAVVLVLMRQRRDAPDATSSQITVTHASETRCTAGASSRSCSA
jgi:hypothetical protein